MGRLLKTTHPWGEAPWDLHPPLLIIDFSIHSYHSSPWDIDTVETRNPGFIPTTSDSAHPAQQFGLLPIVGGGPLPLSIIARTTYKYCRYATQTEAEFYDERRQQACLVKYQ